MAKRPAAPPDFVTARLWHGLARAAASQDGGDEDEGGGGDTPAAWASFDFQTQTYTVDGETVALSAAIVEDADDYASTFAPENISGSGWLFESGHGFAFTGAVKAAILSGATIVIDFETDATGSNNGPMLSLDTADFINWAISFAFVDEFYVADTLEPSVNGTPGFVSGSNIWATTFKDLSIDASLNGADAVTTPKVSRTYAHAVFRFANAGTLTVKSIRIYVPPLAAEDLPVVTDGA